MKLPNKLLTVVAVVIPFFFICMIAIGSNETAYAESAASSKDESVVNVSTCTVPGYFKVKDTCDWAFKGLPCVNVRTGPGISYPKAVLHFGAKNIQVIHVQQGQMFYMTDLVKGTDGGMWFKVDQQKSQMRFPGHVSGDWYVPADHFEPVEFSRINPENDAVKFIKVVLHEQKLYACEGDKLVFSTKISSGKGGTPTPTGNFYIFKEYPVRVMEGPLPGMRDQYTFWSPFSMAFYRGGMAKAYIHGAYWHDSFGSRRSHGCVNVSFNDAKWLYNWAPDPDIRQVPVTVVP